MSDHFTLIHIAQASPDKVLTKTQKQFNNLIKKIEEQKQALLEWQDAMPRYNQKISAEYEPLLAEYHQHRVELVYLLDQAHGNKAFTKTDKAKIKHILLELAEHLILEAGKDELKEIHNKYSGSDFDADQEEADAATGDLMKSVLSEMFGLEIDEEADFSSPDKVRAYMDEKMQAAEQEMQEKARAAEEKRAKRKKTQKQLEKEAKQEQEAQNLSRSIREVYRKLAAALHPDREPDADERERKTKLMQRVNAAYENKNLLELLSLQLEAEQIDQEHLNNIAEDRLKYFIKILKEQAQELEDEVLFFVEQFNMKLQRPPFAKLNPHIVMTALEQDTRGLREDIKRLKADIKTFSHTPSLKAFLKTYKMPRKRPADDFDDLFGAFFHEDPF